MNGHIESGHNGQFQQNGHNDHDMAINMVNMGINAKNWKNVDGLWNWNRKKMHRFKRYSQTWPISFVFWSET